MTFPRVLIGQTVNVAGQDYVFGQSTTEGFNGLAELAEMVEMEDVPEDVRRKILALPVNMRVGDKLPGGYPKKNFEIFDDIPFGVLVEALG